MTDQRILKKSDYLIVLAITVAAFALTFRILIDSTDPFDEGMHFLNYAMFKAGKTPYVDYFPLFPPIWTYAHILVEAVFGELLLTQRLWFTAQGLLLVLVCFWCLRKNISSRPIAIGAVVMIIAYGLDTYWLSRWSGLRLAWYLIFFMSIKGYIATEEAKRSALRLFLIGLLAGSSNLYALDVGIHITLTSLFMLFAAFLTRPSIDARSLKNLAVACAGFFSPLILWGAYLALNGVLLEYLKVYYYLYMLLLMPISVKALSGGKLTLFYYKFAGLAIFLAAQVIAMAYLAVYRGLLKRNLDPKYLIPIAAIALSFLLSASTIRAINGPQFDMFAFIPLVLWGGWLLDRIIARCGVKRLAVIIPIVVVFVLAPYPLFVNTIFAKYKTAKKNISLAESIVADDAYLNTMRPELATLKGLYGPTYFDTIGKYLEAHTTPDESILAFPVYVELVPALAKRHNATRFPTPMLLIGSPEYQQKYIEEIELEKPRYLLFLPDAKYGGKLPVAPYFEPVYDYIYSHYSPVNDIPFNPIHQVWKRID